MSVGKRYVLDANVFIQAHRAHYAFDICPAFWNALILQCHAKRVYSIDRIKAELVVLSDPLADWAKQSSPEVFFKGTADQKVIDAFATMVRWVQSEAQFTPEAKAEFSSVADGWLVAFAKVNRLTVVTHEVFAPDVKKKVPIPNVCLEFDVEYCDPFAMLRELKEQFVLKTRRRKR
jgi:hypothetical protein